MVSLMMMIMFVMICSRVFTRILGETDQTHRHRRFRRMRREQVEDGIEAEPAAKLPPARVETPIELLQRRFAEGEMTVEQYEREVGKLYGVKQD